MSTNSNIGIENPDGSVEFIYCHWDGYPSNNGKILKEHYSDPAKIRELIELGSLSSLAAEIGKKHPFDDDEHKNWCTFYGRDRGDTEVEKQVANDRHEYVEGNNGQTYNYLFSNGEWWVLGKYHTPLTWIKLDEALTCEECLGQECLGAGCGD